MSPDTEAALNRRAAEEETESATVTVALPADEARALVADAWPPLMARHGAKAGALSLRALGRIRRALREEER